jgi:hypothetical protein
MTAMREKHAQEQYDPTSLKAVIILVFKRMAMLNTHAISNHLYIFVFSCFIYKCE